MKMIEKMARALFEADCALCADYVITPETWDSTKRKPAYSALAKAALTTLLEPDEGMVEAARHARSEGHNSANCLTAAIQHALAEGE